MNLGTAAERLLKHRAVVASGCWLWTGYTKRATKNKPYLPYGYIHIGSRTDKTSKAVQVQRVAAAVWMGLDLSRSDIHVLHKCDEPRCFNPDHLYFGDNIANVKDRHSRGRSRGGTSRTRVWTGLEMAR
jgi:hypothetical protein